MSVPRTVTTPAKLTASLRATRTKPRSTTRTIAGSSIAGEHERPPRIMATPGEARKIAKEIPREFLICRRGHQWPTDEAPWLMVPGSRPAMMEQRVQCSCCKGWRIMEAIRVQGRWVRVPGYKYEMPEGYSKDPNNPHLTSDDFLDEEIRRSLGSQ